MELELLPKHIQDQIYSYVDHVTLDELNVSNDVWFKKFNMDFYRVDRFKMNRFLWRDLYFKQFNKTRDFKSIDLSTEKWNYIV